MDIFTPKQRMLNAYRGIFSDRPPVAPELWNYIGAKVLGVTMMEFEREGLLADGLHAAFRKYETEGWGAAFPEVLRDDRQVTETLTALGGGRYQGDTEFRYGSRHYSTVTVYDAKEPSWVVKHLASSDELVTECAEMELTPCGYDFTKMNAVYDRVGEDYLLEAWIGVPFFDFFEGLCGFETAVNYFADEDEADLLTLREKYLLHQTELVDSICDNTPYESFVIGCSSSCNSLIGPHMWRKWDKPYIEAMARLLHSRGKLLHIHFHGRSIETVSDFAQIGIDCVCPFERAPGGDVNTMEDLLHVRAALEGNTAFNGNVHTVETLLRGTPDDVRREVRQIKDAFAGSPRLIIGTGDQVAADTPEENLYAMADEAKRV